MDSTDQKAQDEIPPAPTPQPMDASMLQLALHLEEANELVAHLRNRGAALRQAIAERDERIAELEAELQQLRHPRPRPVVVGT